MNHVTSQLASREIIQSIIQNGSLSYRKQGGTRKPLAKEKLKFIGGKQKFRMMTSSHWLSCDIFHWLGLLLSKKKIFLFLTKVVK